ncbi:MarR family winged helix-turn-helix transcriptional regulator [Nocardia sp. NPDC058176]|uniref:MarR family winged helix-turn-helix transcriptional regulator n=1 Tax=Nocardia sp. NPDC058176 TaxID=3346368 RepID=UPI0036D8C399
MSRTTPASDPAHLADTHLGPHSRIGALARRLALVVTDQVQDALRAEGLTELRPVHLRVFAALGPDARRVTQIADRLSTTKQTVGPIVDELVTLGYLQRRVDSNDARAKLVELTPAGRTAAEAALRAAEAIDRRLAERVGEARLAECRTTLWELVESESTGNS